MKQKALPVRASDLARRLGLDRQHFAWLVRSGKFPQPALDGGAFTEQQGRIILSIPRHLYLSPKRASR